MGHQGAEVFKDEVRDSEVYIIGDVRTHFVKVTVKLSRLIPRPPVTFTSASFCVNILTSLNKCVDKCKTPKAVPAEEALRQQSMDAHIYTT